MTTTRTLNEIARDIQRHWTRVTYSAAPYLSAMRELESIDDRYVHDSGREIVLRFLANAMSWRGEHARRIKAELKQIVA